VARGLAIQSQPPFQYPENPIRQIPAVTCRHNFNPTQNSPFNETEYRSFSAAGLVTFIKNAVFQRVTNTSFDSRPVPIAEKLRTFFIRHKKITIFLSIIKFISRHFKPLFSLDRSHS
jgi:hypothetical protein